MYVHVNNFDYDELLNGLVKHYHLDDVPLTDEIVSKIFESISEKYKLNKRNTMSELEISLVEEFFRVVSLWSDFMPGDDTETFLESKGMEISESLALIEEVFLAGVGEEDELNRLFEIATKFEGYDFTDEESIGEFSANLSNLIDSYNNMQWTDAELFILGHIDRALMDLEILTDVEVVPVAGKVVKYGDTLITFPIILIKVSNP